MFEIIEGIQPEDRRDRESNGEIAADRDSGEADFPVFRVVEGKLSDRYNHFLDYAFDSCTATNTRLMGVVAMRLDWHSVSGRKYHLCQLIHLDFSEYGIDDYMEYFSDPALRGYSDIFSKPELDMQWTRISGSLGGEEVSLSLDEAMLLIDRALFINQKYRGQHPEEIREFRETILPRIELMRTQVSGSPDPEETLLKVCPKKLTANETINYFLMRLFDHDFDAACLLTSLSREELEELPAMRHGLMTLTRNEISRDNGPTLFHRVSGETVHCLSLAEMEQYPGYRYLRTALVVSPHPDRKWYCVTECGCEFDMNISQAEAALQLREPEYISVYKILNKSGTLDLTNVIMPYRGQHLQKRNGLACFIYNSNNSHVDSSTYYLNHDVYGIYMVTTRGELVIMSGSIVNISMMEMNLQRLAHDLEIVGRYQFNEQVFSIFIEQDKMLFSDFIELIT